MEALNSLMMLELMVVWLALGMQQLVFLWNRWMDL